MKIKFLLAILLLSAFITQAQAQSSGGGFYTLIPYYGNNPFLFCTLGVPTDCWAPINPATGTFTVINPYCYNPVSSALYAQVCPQAFPKGVPGQNATSSAASEAPAQ
ncbi:hypothetical protein [Xanthomonas graminis]|uniref:Secreted protein n=1 Tax=Xanthomonas graminis pv. phlei TaxID=487906 RepID=A0A0K3A6W4_9XANT|nr:hypothetical protein [Xanthomonas translucens]UKE66035.1 hypothetical protein KM547_01355 [Xanthomonas translucens pv. phlei]CTP91230.1 hypothetical protein XTPLMG730_3090 [Xanthomonas translucens pv. phlei]